MNYDARLEIPSAKSLDFERARNISRWLREQAERIEDIAARNELADDFVATIEFSHNGEELKG